MITGAVLKKRVWVLGSGFSRSLGGPLLNELLSHRGEAYVRTKFPKFDRSVYELYRSHLRDAPESLRKPVYWDHAEEFVDFLNTSSLAGNPTRYKILAHLLYPSMPKGFLSRRTKVDLIKPLRDNVLRCLAGECLFTTHSSPASESWRPYFKWAAQLDKNDTIISFNYDVVLETLGAEKAALNLGAESVVVPKAWASEDFRAGRQTPILKLHGSVSWFKDGNVFTHTLAPDRITWQLGRKNIPLIATPGPNKLELQEQDLSSIWERAEAALREASVVVFMGYRFPPSDSQAREVLLRALNNNVTHMLNLHTVLGPRTGDDDSVRLAKLLEHSMRQAGRGPLPKKEHEIAEGEHPKFYKILAHPLYVEDFMTVMHGWMLV
jgi:hypothetical protein